MLNVTDDILAASDQNIITALVQLDYSKAFDTVDHITLIAILKCLGLNDSALLLMSNYLQGRIQSLKLETKISNPLSISRGVPQGSILSPLLFSIYTSTL